VKESIKYRIKNGHKGYEKYKKVAIKEENRRKASLRSLNGPRHVSANSPQTKKKRRLNSRREKLRRIKRLKQTCNQSKMRVLHISVRPTERTTRDLLTSLDMSAHLVADADNNDKDNGNKPVPFKKSNTISISSECNTPVPLCQGLDAHHTRIT
jgi:hypothetical protein